MMTAGGTMHGASAGKPANLCLAGRWAAYTATGNHYCPSCMMETIASHPACESLSCEAPRQGVQAADSVGREGLPARQGTKGGTNDASNTCVATVVKTSSTV